MAKKNREQDAPEVVGMLEPGKEIRVCLISGRILAGEVVSCSAQNLILEDVAAQMNIIPLDKVESFVEGLEAPEIESETTEKEEEKEVK